MPLSPNDCKTVAYMPCVPNLYDLIIKLILPIYSVILKCSGQRVGLLISSTSEATSKSLFIFGSYTPQIKSESFLEDINNILNSGDVPNIYGFDDMDQILNGMKPVVVDQGLQATKANLFSAYTKRVKSNIHTVLCMR